jgi:hypothetical protein
MRHVEEPHDAARIPLVGGYLRRPKKPKTWWGRALLWPFFDWRIEPVARVFERLPEPVPNPDKVAEPSAAELLHCPTTQRNWDEAINFVAEAFWSIVAAIFHH